MSPRPAAATPSPAPRGAGSVVFAGGGTGGHLYPSLAIAEELDRAAAPMCLFLCSTRPIDAEILSAAGVEFRPVPAGPFSLRPLGLARFMSSWGPSLRAARHALRDLPGPRRLLTMGGYVAAPAARAARLEDATITLVNIDAVPGRANRWIARSADRIFTTAPMTAGPGAAWVTIPPIVRRAALPPGPPPACRAMLGLRPDLSTLFVTGGSLGARTINRMMPPLAKSALRGSGWQVLHQCGSEDRDELAAAYDRAGVPAVVRPFFDPMGPAWGSADLAISRAGAGSVAEAWAASVPAIFLPYPHHRDQHQKANARRLVEAGGAVVVDDRIDAGLNASSCGPVLAQLMTDDAARRDMRAGLATLGPADGAARVAAWLLSAS